MNGQNEEYFSDYVEEVSNMGRKDFTVPAGFFKSCTDAALGLEPVHFRVKERMEAHYVIDNYRLVIRAYKDDPEVYGSIFEEGKHGKARFACVGDTVPIVFSRLNWFKRQTDRHKAEEVNNERTN